MTQDVLLMTYTIMENVKNLFNIDNLEDKYYEFTL